MPTIGTTMVIRGGQITMYDRASAEDISQEEWFARVQIKD